MKRPSMLAIPLAGVAMLISAVACARFYTFFPVSTLPPAATTQPATITQEPAVTIVPSQAMRQFALLYYPPLVLDYDPSIWNDLTDYGKDIAFQTNALQSTTFVTCKIDVQGPTEFPGMPGDQIQLGKINYLRFSFVDHPEETVSWYIENKSLVDYNYDAGLPIPVIKASKTEWEECKRLGEQILTTLRIP